MPRKQINVRIDLLLVDILRGQLAALYPHRPPRGAAAAVRWAIEDTLDRIDERNAVRTRTVTTKCGSCGYESTWSETDEPAQPRLSPLQNTLDLLVQEGHITEEQRAATLASREGRLAPEVPQSAEGDL